MKKRKLGVFLSTLLVFITLFSFPAFAADSGYVIENMNVDVVVNDAREMRVTETITVNYLEERQGIYRSIPTYGDGESYIIEDIQVEGANYEIETYGDYVDIRIGDAGVYVTGLKTYTITYTLYFYADYLADGDYIYLNLVGNDWDTSIESFSGSITYPQNATFDRLVLTSGYYGAASNDREVEWSRQNNVVYLNSTKSLRENESITANIRLNEGAFSNAPAFQFPYTVNQLLMNTTLTKAKEYQISQQFVVSVPEDPFGQSKFPLWVDLPLYVNNTEAIISNLNMSFHSGQEPTVQNGYLRWEIFEPGEYTIYLEYLLTLPMKEPITLNLIGDTEIPFEDVQLYFESEVPFTSPEVTFGRPGDPAFYELIHSEQSLQLHSNKVLYPAERFKVSLTVDEGLFHRSLSPLFYLLFAGCAICLVVAFLIYWLFGRDKKLSSVVEVYPPDGINSPEAGYILNGKTSSKEIISILYNWANAGFIKLSDLGTDDEITIIKQTEIDESRPVYERKLFNDMFARGDGNVVTAKKLKNRFYKDILKAHAGILSKFDKGEHALYKKNSVFKMVTFLIGLVPFALLTFVATSLHNEPLYLMGSIVAVVAYSGTNLAWTVMQQQWNRKSRGTIISYGLVSALLFALYFMSTLFWVDGFGVVPFYVCAITVLSATAISVISIFVPQRTAYGMQVTERLMGFRRFIEVAEKSRLEALLEQDPTYFYNVLPYAQVFGLTKIWSDKFKDIILPEPEWYETTTPWNSVQTAIFLSRMQGSMARLGSTAVQTPPPPSSAGGFGGSSSGGSFGGSGGGGFSGGGFSGGGGGGGGGRSW